MLRMNKRIEVIREILDVTDPSYAEADVRIDSAGKTVQTMVDAMITLINERLKIHIAMVN